MSEEEKAKIAKEKLKESDERVDMRVYDCPQELKNELISMSKLYYDNEMWKAIADALELLKKEKDGEFDDRYDEVEKRLSELEEEVHHMKMMDTYSGLAEESNEQTYKPGLGEAPEPDKDKDATEQIDKLNDLQRDDSQ